MGPGKESPRERLLKQIDEAIRKIDKKRGEKDDREPVERKPDRRE